MQNKLLLWGARTRAVLELVMVRLDSFADRVKATNMLREFALGLGLYQLLFGVSLLLRPQSTMGSESWRMVTAAVEPQIIGLGMLALSFGSFYGAWRQSARIVNNVVIIQGIMWAWWAVSIFAVSTRDHGGFSGTITYGYAAYVFRTFSRALMKAERIESEGS